MAVNNDFLGQITDALVSRTSEPGKLDDVAVKFGEIVRSLKQSVQSFDKMHAQMTAIFKEATRQARRQGTEISAQELTRISNKISEPLHVAVQALRQSTSELNRNAVAQHKATQNFERETSARFARLQQKMEMRATRAISSPTPPADKTSFQAQLSHAFSELKGVQVKAAAAQQTFEQQFLAAFRGEVREMRREIGAKLSEQGRAGWSRPHIGMVEDLPATQYGAPGSGHRLDYRSVRNKELLALDEWAVRRVIGSIEGGTEARARRPAHSTQYGIKKGAGMAAETTPAYLGAAAIKLEHQFQELSRFLDHLRSVIGDPAAAKNLYGMVAFQRQYVQEKRQQNLGRGTVPRENVMLGEDLTYATVAQVNSRIYHGALPPSYWDSRRERASARAAERRLEPKVAMARSIMAQPWARSDRSYDPTEIDAFLGQHGGRPSGASIGPAAQMLWAGGVSGHRVHELLNVVLGGWSANRTARNTAAAVLSRDAYKLLAAPMSSSTGAGEPPRPGERPTSEARRRAMDAMNRRRAGQRGGATLDFLDFLNPFSKRSKEPPPRDYRAEMRYDATYEKLKKLADAIDATTKSFRHLEEVTAPQKRAAIGERRARASEMASRRMAGVAGAQSAAESDLGFRALEAQTSLEFAQERALRVAKKLRSAKAVGGVVPKSASEREALIASITGGITAAPGMRAAMAEYAAGTAGISDEGQLAAARKIAAEKYAAARYGARPGEKAGAAETLRGRVEALLGGRETPAQKADFRAGAIERDERAALGRLGAAERKIDDDVAQAKIKNERRVEDLKRAGRVATERFEKGEAALAARGGGRGAGGGRRGGGMSGLLGVTGESGYGSLVGLGFLLGWDKALKETIKDSAIYAARTEMMEFATSQMAKTAGLNVGQVNAEVEAIKKLNVTTQVAHQTVQRFIMMQIDVAKAAKMVAVAQDLAAISGADAMETVSRLSQAVLTGYTRNLHMMGLQVTAIGMMRELKAQRRAEGKTGEPSMMEQRQALVNKILLEGAKVAGTYERSLSTAGGQFAYLRKEVQETENVFGREFLPVFGKAMLMMTGGLRTVQKHAEGFATLAKVLAGVSSALTVLMASRALSMLAGSAGLTTMLGAASPYVAAAVGLGTVAYLTQDKSKMIRGVSAEQQTMLAEHQVRLESERASILAHPGEYGGEGSAEFRNALEQVNAALRSVATQIVATVKDLNEKLAEEYAKTSKDLDDFASGKASIWTEISLAARGLSPSPFGDREKNAASIKAKALRRIVGDRGSVAETEAAMDEVEAAVARRRKVEALPPEIRNKMTEWLSTMGSEFLGASTELEKYADLANPATRRMRLRAAKSGGTPREKATLDYAFAMDSISKSAGFLGEIEKKRVSKRPEDKLAYETLLKDTLGKGDKAAGLKALEDLKKDVAEGRGLLGENLGIELGKIVEQTNVQIAQIEEQTKVARILGGVQAGNYESELAGIEAVLALKERNIELGKTIRREDTDAARVAKAAAGGEAQQARDALLKREITKQAGLRAQGNVAIFEGAQRVAEAMAGSSEFDTMFGRRTELEQGKMGIARQRAAQIALAQYAYEQERRVPGVDADELEQRRRDAINAANSQAREAAIALGAESRKTASERLIERYGRSLQIKEQTAQGTSTSEAQDRAVAANVHELRLQYIRMEFEARLKGGANYYAAERMMAEENLEVESAKLQEMLAARRKQADDVKSFGSEFFMTAVTDHARGLRDMLMGKVKGTGATIAGNALRSLIGTSPLLHLPNKLLETVDSEGRRKPTKLGELLSGTRLGTPVASEREIQAQLTKVTGENNVATSENTSALNRLTDVATRMMQEMGIAYTPVPRMASPVGGGGYTLRSGGVPTSWGGGGALSYTPVPLGIGGGAVAPASREQVTSGISYDTEGVPSYIPPYDGSFGVPESVSTGGGGGVVSAPASAGAAAQQLQRVLSAPALAKVAQATHTSNILNLLKTVPGIAKLIPALKTLGGGGVGAAPTATLQEMADLGVITPSSASGKIPSAPVDWQQVSSDIQGAAMIGTGAYQAATMMGKGTRGDLFAAGGIAQAGAGAAQLFAKELGPIAPGVEAGMEVASLVADMFGSMYMDPKQKRSNQIANYLGMLQYMAPAQIAMTSSLRGSMVSEGKGGGATDTGIASSALQVTQPYMEQINPNPAWYSQPLQYLLGSNRPGVTQVPGLPSGMFPSADSLGGSQQYDYAGVPGQVLYNDLPGNAVPTNYGTMNVNINALDSKSVIDRAPDIAAAIQQQLRMGGSLASSLQSAVFGVG